jgi:hypothetical protein
MDTVHSFRSTRARTVYLTSEPVFHFAVECLAEGGGDGVSGRRECHTPPRGVDDDDTYQAFACLACTRVHLVNLTGGGRGLGRGADELGTDILS